eukprot:m.275250 g.275250  ORF g.275250 m.275250 type:complete len:53 (+) comp103494_c0_seq1:18-176(+)
MKRVKRKDDQGNVSGCIHGFDSNCDNDGDVAANECEHDEDKGGQEHAALMIL